MNNWRSSSLEFAEIGRSLGTIERMIRDVRAIAAVDDSQARNSVEASYSAARKLVQHIDALRRSFDD